MITEKWFFGTEQHSGPFLSSVINEVETWCLNFIGKSLLF